MASKGGVHALTVRWDAELARYRIRVDPLAPGIIRTPSIDDADALAGIHPLGRVGEVRDTSDAALFLARAGFVTGTILEVDGGFAHGRSGLRRAGLRRLLHIPPVAPGPSDTGSRDRARTESRRPRACAV